ncbi:MAG: 4-(cytidine 5'-diphospho)-2-C-methyl-D-erythritol kinase [Oscillospiraceae bacterium]|jgi:4-diphosphocytidyl-2-C-methyl-D-erythritol kinase|nr:4-(cytidine 5'-diphospho)-2-C-methyl-D-erythritol kinase [Oscillospiraceae bacterium]
MIIKAYCKINLGLKILGKYPNGMHEIETITQSINLCDYIQIRVIEEKKIEVLCNKNICSNFKNIGLIAAEKFFEKFGFPNFGISIKIKKNIPIQAGLGGGSADAAAILVGLNKIFGNIANPKTLINIAIKIGSDVPICLTGGTLLYSKNSIFKLNNLSGCRILINKPKWGISTSCAYKDFDKNFNDRGEHEVLNLKKSIKRNIISDVYSNTFNDFEKNLNIEKNYRLTGSGSARYRIFKKNENIEEEITQSLKIYDKVFNSKNINNEDIWDVSENFGVFVCKPKKCGVEVIDDSWNRSWLCFDRLCRY